MPASRRGVNRSVYSSLVDDPDFQTLTANARLALLTARLSKQAGPGCIFRYYPEVLARQSGLASAQLAKAVAALVAGGWLECDGAVMWIRNGLRYDPTMRLSDPKHRKAVERALLELPRRKIVLRFCEYYGLARPFEDQGQSTVTEDREPKTENREPTTTTTAPAGAAAVAAGNGKVASESWATAAWGSVEALAHLYNTEAPDNVPAVESLSEKRRERARRMLRQFPGREWWEEVFKQYKASRFLSGRSKPGAGHENFRPDWDWLMATGKTGTENAVKVHDGAYS